MSPAPGSATALITAVVPTYNVARYLPDFFRSIDAQTNDLQEVEFIFVIDGSPDESAALIEAWLETRPAVRARVLYQENAGLSGARNSGLEAASSEWITFPDPDDAFEPNYFEEVVKFIRLHGRPELTLLAAHLMKTDDEGVITDNHPSRKRFERGSRVVDMNVDPVVQLGVNHAFLRTELLRVHGLTFDGRIRPTFEDAHTVGRYLLRSGSHHIGLMASAKYLYRVRSDNSSLVQGGYDRPEKYTNVLRYGELDLLHEALAKGPVPRWVEFTVLYDLAWYFRNERVARSATASAPREALSEFHDLARQILGIISADAIWSFNGIWIPQEVRLALLYGYGENFRRPQQVQIGAVDESRQLVQFLYWFNGTLPDEEWMVDGEHATPIHETIEDIEYYGRVLVRRRIVWLRRGLSTALRLDGRSVQFARGDERALPETVTKATLDPHIVAQRKRELNPWKLQEGRLAAAKRDARAVFNRFFSERERRRRPVLRRARSKSARERFSNAWVFMDRDTDANDNAEHQYRWTRDNHPEVNSWFVLSRSSNDWARLEADGFRLVEYKSRDWFSLMLHARHLASSHIDNYVVHPLPRGDYGLERFAFTFLQHGVIHNDLSRWLNNKRVDVFVTSTPQEKDAIAGVGPYKFTDKEVVLTGLPRHDALLERRAATLEQHRDLIVVMPTWRQSLVGSAVRGSNQRDKHLQFDSSEYAQAFRQLLSSPRLEQIAAQSGKTVAFMPHPNMTPYLDDFAVPAHVRTLSFAKDNVQEILARACAFVTDYTSVAFDAALLRIPITYFQFDRAEFFGGLHVGRTGYFDHREDGFGPVVETVEGVLEALSTDAANGWIPASEYLAREDAAFVADDGRNRERVFIAMRALDGAERAEEPTVTQTDVTRT